MRRAATSLILIALILIGSGNVLGEESEGARDHLCGWFKLDNKLIPVFKVDGTYYTTMRRGFEIPLEECPEGLELSPKVAGGVAGTKIGLDEESNEVYISLVDQNREYVDSSFTSGEKQPMTAIAKPSWLRDATSQPPTTNDDFVGWYEAAWCPYLRGHVQKEGDKYLLAVQVIEKTVEKSSWVPHMQHELIPLADGLGFALEREEDLQQDGVTVRLIFNAARSRFELEVRSAAPESRFSKMPLARIPAPSLDEDTATLPPMEIGIPAWD